MTGDWFMSYDEVPAERFQASGIFIYLTFVRDSEGVKNKNYLEVSKKNSIFAP
jgi:hypothetical protein